MYVYNKNYDIIPKNAFKNLIRSFKHANTSMETEILIFAGL